MTQLNVKTNLYLTNQLIQVNQWPSPLLPQVVVRCDLNFLNKYILLFLLVVVLKFKAQLGLPFEEGNELADLKQLII